MELFSKQFRDILTELAGEADKYWNIPAEVGQILYFLIRSARPLKILEIGTSTGYSGLWMAKALEDNFRDFQIRGKLVTVESHAERFSLSEKNFNRAGLTDFITQKKGHAPEIFMTDAEIAAGDFDMMFFDATKKQHVEFLKQGFSLLNSGGLIIADNVLSHFEEMQKFLKVAEEMQNFSGDVLKVGDGVFIGLKNK